MTIAKSDLVNFIDFTLFSMTCAQILDYLVSKGKKENLPRTKISPIRKRKTVHLFKIFEEARGSYIRQCKIKEIL